jgi:RHS repeat-associated protein
MMYVKEAMNLKIKPVPPLLKTAYNYKYNGKEYQDELGLNMYAMDMRQYDPAIARWVVQDPVVHLSVTPYAAFDNNPVIFSDPSGADAVYNWDGPNKGQYTDNGEVVSFETAMGQYGFNEDDSEKAEGQGDPGRRRPRQRERNRGRVGSGSFIFDARGQELFSHWLSGSGKDLILKSEVWQDYMRDNEILNNELISQAFSMASGMSDRNEVNSSFASGNFPFEIQNGYFTGYQMLHGTLFFSFGVVGKYDKKTDSYSFNFNLKWYDKINPNHSYGADTKANDILNKFYSPKDYSVEIRWTQTITVSGADIKNNNINGTIASGR